MKWNPTLAVAHVNEVCEQLSGTEELASCLLALKEQERGEERFGADDSDEALTHFATARDLFSRTEEAKYLLGITNSHMAAAYGQLGQHEAAKQMAHEALQILEGDERFSLTAAMCYMTLAISASHEGNVKEAFANFNMSSRILHAIDAPQHFKEMLTTNMSIAQSRAEADVPPLERRDPCSRSMHAVEERQHRWWKLWN